MYIRSLAWVYCICHQVYCICHHLTSGATLGCTTLAIKYTVEAMLYFRSPTWVSCICHQVYCISYHHGRSPGAVGTTEADWQSQLLLHNSSYNSVLSNIPCNTCSCNIHLQLLSATCVVHLLTQFSVTSSFSITFSHLHYSSSQVFCSTILLVQSLILQLYLQFMYYLSTTINVHDFVRLHNCYNPL